MMLNVKPGDVIQGDLFVASVATKGPGEADRCQSCGTSIKPADTFFRVIDIDNPSVVLEMHSSCAESPQRRAICRLTREQHATIKLIARLVTTWEIPILKTAHAYAEALTTGAVAPVTNMAQWRWIPAILGCAVDEAVGVDGDAWQTGIGSIHGLAHGVIERLDRDEHHGTPDALNIAWTVEDCDAALGDGVTLKDLAVAFGGDVLAAAAAFLTACAGRH